MSLNELANQINRIARDHGFWEADRNFGEMIALAHSELSEALEEHRDGRPAEYWPQVSWGGEIVADHERARVLAPGVTLKPEGVAVELADCIIRCLDTMHSLGVDIDAVVARKMAYNASRPYKHGKAY